MGGRWLIGALVVVLACAESTSPPAEVSWEDFQARYVETYFALLERCCAQAMLPAPDQRTIRFPGATEPELASGERYNPAAGARCLALLEREDCTSLKASFPASSWCEVFDRGTTALGQPCDHWWECAGSDDYLVRCFEVTSEGDDVPRCRGIRYSNVGAACGNVEGFIADHCMHPAVCDFDRGRCVSPPPLGADCPTNLGTFPTDTCAAGSVCDFDTARCETPLPIGDACDSPDQCEGHQCTDGLCREPYWQTAGHVCDERAP